MSQLDKSRILLRPETGGDRDFLLALYCSTRESELKNIGWTAAAIKSFLTQQFDAQYQSYRNLYPNADYQVVEYRGKAIGRLYLNRGQDEFRLIDIALLPDFRNRKIGQNLVQGVLNDAADKQISVCLHVEQDNAARRLYTRMGFEIVERRNPYLFMRWQPPE